EGPRGRRGFVRPRRFAPPRPPRLPVTRSRSRFLGGAEHQGLTRSRGERGVFEGAWARARAGGRRVASGSLALRRPRGVFRDPVMWWFAPGASGFVGWNRPRPAPSPAG